MPRELTVKVIAMPSDTNPDGDMFGGWIVSQMDLAGYLVARKMAHKLVTVAMEGIEFLSPVFIGDCLECFTEVERVGSSSIKVRVVAFAERKSSGEKVKVTEGSFVYVSIDKDRKASKLSKK